MEWEWGWVQGAASQLADLFAGSGDKIFGALGFGRFLLLAWLIMQLWDGTHGWCFAGLLLAGAQTPDPPDGQRRAPRRQHADQHPDTRSSPLVVLRRVLLAAAPRRAVGEWAPALPRRPYRCHKLTSPYSGEDARGGRVGV